MDLNFIRNFVIIAHVDHGKSTLADRFLELTSTISLHKFREQFLDQMELERERGITIKMAPVRMIYKSEAEFSGSEFILNLIDTPGHVDFSYEVSRSLAAVEGAILLVDGTQGIQAQTIANLELAKREGLKIIGVINKIDLLIPDITELKKELANLIGTTAEKILQISAKTGQGVKNLLEEVIKQIPPPTGSTDAFFRALVFDSKYDPFRGVIAYIRVKDGKVRKGAKLQFVATSVQFEATEIGYFKPELSPCQELIAGEIGYIATGLKEVGVVKVGDTIISEIKDPKIEVKAFALPGYREPQPMIFAGFYPIEENSFQALRDALLKLKLNDASLIFSEERQEALGKGLRVGFLGVLHMEIVKERLSREYGIEPIVTMPSVRYRIKLKNGAIKEIETPQQLPSEQEIIEIQEPWIKGEIILPGEYLGSILELVKQSRGEIKTVESLERGRVLLKFEAPLAEVIIGFYDKLKSVSRGYASATYEISDWRKGDLVKLDILIAHEIKPELSRIVSKQNVESLARSMVLKLKELLPQELFPVALQAAVSGRIIARETIPALRKNVTAHLYGGDRTRKMKLWKKQKEGKKRLAINAKIKVEPKIFFELLKLEEGKSK